MPPGIGGSDAHRAHRQSVNTRHMHAAVAVLGHEIQSVYTQQMWTVQGPSMCFIHSVNRCLLSYNYCAHCMGTGSELCTKQTQIPPLLHLHSGVGKQIIHMVRK